MSYVEKESVLERLENLGNSGDLSDATFLVGPEEEEVKGHSLLFAIASPVFFKMFFGSLPERSGVIKVPDITPTCFESMKTYMYTDALPLTSIDHACGVIEAARKYMMPSLEKKCLHYLEQQVCVSTVLELKAYAKEFFLDGLTKRCLQILQSDTVEFLESEDLMEADSSEVLEIVQLPELILPSELYLFRKIEEWAKRRAETLRKELGELAGELSDIVGSIRFLAMSGKDFASGPADSPLLTSEEKVAICKCLMIGGDSGYPERLSASPDQRTTEDRARTRCAFSFRFEVSAIRKLSIANEDMFSEVCHYVCNVPWKFNVYYDVLHYYFYLCTEDTQKMIKAPKVCKGRVLDQSGEELENDMVGKKGWVDAEKERHDDGYLMLRFCYIRHSKLQSRFDKCTSIVLEALISED